MFFTKRDYIGGEHSILKSLLRCGRRTNTAYEYSYYQSVASTQTALPLAQNMQLLPTSSILTVLSKTFKINRMACRQSLNEIIQCSEQTWSVNTNFVSFHGVTVYQL